MITIELKEDYAEELLMSRGWKIARSEERGTYYVKPEGENHLKGGVEGVDYLTDMAKAVEQAIAETMGQ